MKRIVKIGIDNSYVKYSLYSHPSVSTGDWFQDPRGYPNPQMLKSLI